MKGLNSNTFNYLETNKEVLSVGKDIPRFTKNADGSAQDINSVRFFSQCVRLNKPCIIEGLAKSWNAYKLWTTKNGEVNETNDPIGKKYMLNLIGENQLVKVYEMSEDEHKL